MRIWFLENGIDKVCDQPVTVIAEWIHSYFIEHQSKMLKCIPKDFVTAKLYNDYNDIAPSILEYLSNHPEIEAIDWSMEDMFKTVQ